MDGMKERKTHESRSHSFVLSLSQDEVGVGRDDGRRAGSTMEGRGGGGRRGRGSAHSKQHTWREKLSPPSTSLSPVAQRRRDLQLALLADAGADEALVPALDDLAGGGGGGGGGLVKKSTQTKSTHPSLSLSPPSFSHSPSAQRELKRRAAVQAGVELGAVLKGAGVVDWGGGKEKGGGETCRGNGLFDKQCAPPSFVSLTGNFVAGLGLDGAVVRAGLRGGGGRG